MPDDKMSLTLVPGTEPPDTSWHAAFTAAFADYLIGPFQLSLAQWPGFLARQGVDLALSRAAVVDGRLLAFALVAPRPGLVPPRWRLGTMGAVPEARGAGLAPQLLDDFLTRAAAHGAAFAELEVFAANERALRLYQGRGFEIVHGLVGYERPPAAAATAPQAWRAWRLGSAQLVFADRPGEPLALLSLVDPDPAQAGAEALAVALAAAFPGRLLRMPPLQRADIGGDALERAGFVRQPLHQWLMRRPL